MIVERSHYLVYHSDAGTAIQLEVPWQTDVGIYPPPFITFNVDDGTQRIFRFHTEYMA
jgi:hypothetical protein